MSMQRVARVLSAVLLVGFTATATSAQTLGTFRWQLLPYCNVVSVTVVQQGAHYQLHGTDDQCGAGPLAGVTGLAFLNPDTSIGFGLNIVTTPGGAPVHVDATIALATLGGSWRDSAGATGTFAFMPGASAGGSPRPAGGIGLSSINPAQVQTRVAGTCAAGQLISGINQDGSVECGSAGGPGDITAVGAGPGLVGGGVAGAIALAVNFGGSGAAAAAARSDHTHAGPETNSTRVGVFALRGATTGTHNTALGSGAMELTTSGAHNAAVGAGALYGNVTGEANVALGYNALANNGEGGLNTAVGMQALLLNTTSANTAVGAGALSGNVTGLTNTAIGTFAAGNNVSGSGNVALGYRALILSVGDNNIAVGEEAGDSLVNGSHNIYIGADGLATESNATYIGNISGSTSSSGATVFVNSAGKLGTATSSRRFKEDIDPLGDVSRLVQALRPVSFHYKPEFDDGSRVRQYGLIAEDVAEVMPDLVIRDNDGTVQSVRYHFLPPLLLAEVQRLEQARVALAAQVAEQAEAIAELRARLDEMRSRR